MATRRRRMRAAPHAPLIAPFHDHMNGAKPPCGRHMNRFHVKLAITAAAGSLLVSNSIAAQVSPYSPKILPPAVKAAHVRITQGPELESADDNSAIISWTSNNPGGSDEHYAILRYGTNAKELNH